MRTTITTILLTAALLATVPACTRNPEPSPAAGSSSKDVAAPASPIRIELEKVP